VDDGDGLLASIGRRLLRRSDDLVRAQLTELRRFPSYDRVPDEDLRRSCQRNIARVVATLEQRDTLPAEIEEDERASGQRRALQGVPTEDVVRAYRAVIGVLRDAFVAEAAAAAADPWRVIAGTRQLWDLTDRYSDVLVAARQQVDIDTARREEQRRITFLHRLLAGNLDAADLSAGGAVQDMMPNRDYWVVRARAYGGDTQRLTRHLESTGTSFRPLVAPFDNDIVAICAVWPVAADGAVIAVGGPARLSAVPLAFAEATRVLNVALRYRRTGVVDQSALSVRMAVEEHDVLGEQLLRRHLAPVAAAGGSADILDTLRTYLNAGRSIAATAAALSVHPNTIRYRLARFESLAGADLSSTDTVVEVWWALEYAAIRQVSLDNRDAIDAAGGPVST